VRDKLFNHSEVIAEEVSSSCRLRNIVAGWMRREINYIEEVTSLAVEA
jgi:ribosomal protein S17E